MTTRYFDTSYIFKLYALEPGHEDVARLLPDTKRILTAWHGRAEFASALHRKAREADLPDEVRREVHLQFLSECQAGHITFLPLTVEVMERLEAVLDRAPPSTYVRAADALHLACAATHGFTEVYSHDRHFLAAAPHFGLRGIDVIRNRS